MAPCDAVQRLCSRVFVEAICEQALVALGALVTRPATRSASPSFPLSSVRQISCRNDGVCLQSLSAGEKETDRGGTARDGVRDRGLERN